MSTIYDRLIEYSKTDAYPFHMPGHKRHLNGDVLSDVSSIDITEIDGFDNLHDAQEIILEAQQKAAALYGAEESFFLVNGSTCGILSAVAACVHNGGWLMMGRNCHKAVYHASLLGNLNTIYLYPEVKEGFSFYDGFHLNYIKNEVEMFYKEHPTEKIGAVIITSPTYEGIISDVKEIADFLHEKNIPLIVDEAHGAHLGLSELVPGNSCAHGADIVIHSLHKTLPAMTQTAILHVNGDMVDRQRLRRYLSIYQSSSPSYVLMASIERALTMMSQDGEKYFKEFLFQKNKLLQALNACKRIQIYQGKDADCCKLILSTRGSVWTGKELYDKLRLEYNLQMEMAAGDYVVAIMTVMDSEEGFERLKHAIIDLDTKLDGEMDSWDGQSAMQETDSVKYPCSVKAKYSIAYALEQQQIFVSVNDAEDRICADFVYVYPPGIPILVPGEQITKEHISYINTIQKQNLDLKGIIHNQIRVLK